jgi:hypothetical protein
MIINVTIVNRFLSQILMFALAVPESFTEKEIRVLYTQFAKFHPDCSINFNWDENHIEEMPVNMVKDQEVLNPTDFVNKWYKRTNFAENANKPVTHDSFLFNFN